ncbi:unnamed protein product, partial [Ectocarpus sp. 13 AM-2016]
MEPRTFPGISEVEIGNVCAGPCGFDPAKPFQGSGLRFGAVVSRVQDVQQTIVHLDLFVDRPVPLACEQVKAGGKCSLENELPVDVVNADRHAATLTNGLQLVRVIRSDD